MLATIVTHLLAATAGVVLGGYLWYRFGSKVAADASLIKSAAGKL